MNKQLNKEENNDNKLFFLDIQKDSFHKFIFSKAKNEENLYNVLEYCLNFNTNEDRFSFTMEDFDIIHKDITQEEEIEIQRNSSSYKLSVNVKIKIKDNKYKESYIKNILLCEIPCITKKGEFLINGVYRVVVPHLLRIKGIFFSINNLTKEHIARVRTMYGKSLEISTKTFTRGNKSITIKIENNKFNWALVATAMWFENLEETFNFMFKRETLDLDFSLTEEKFIEKYTENNVLTFKHIQIEDKILHETLITAHNKKISEIYQEKSLTKAEFYRVEKEDKIILGDINIQVFDQISCANYLYSKMRNSVILGQSQDYIKRTFFDNDFFSLGQIGRHCINRKFGTNFNEFLLRKEDIKNTIFYLLNIYNNKPGFELDDQYSLSNLYIQTVGQYLANDIRSMTLNLKRNMIEKTKVLTRKEKKEEVTKEITSSNFINLSKIGANTRIQRFFLLHPSSQFLSQLNPLSSIMHKTKINTMDDSINSSNDFASFESRNLQKSFYSRLCCITTPDSKMVGLVNFAALNCKLDKNGFLLAPYNRVENGEIKEEIIYLSPFQEENEENFIADFSSRKLNKIETDFVKCRYKGEISLVSKEKINLIDVFRNQTVSLSSCLIPFLEHNDNTRASMGSNMMRQILPSINPIKPMVSTGLESFVIDKSGYDLTAEEDGKILYADSKIIKVQYKNTIKEYNIFPFIRTNQNTLAYIKTNVEKEQEVKRNDKLTSSFSSEEGKLALGKNILTVVMPYEGLNFEDAIVISDKSVKKKMLDCYVINEVIVAPEKTKFGYEKITNQIPHLKMELTDLDEKGVIKIGTIVKKGDILVGKLTPELKEYTNKIDEKIMDIVFGEKTLNFKNTSVQFQGDIGEIIDIVYIKTTSKVSLSKKPETIKIIIGERKPIKVGDKICGRYGNKNIISKIIPESDMPYLKDGRIAEAVINPLGIVSRMNIGQLLEMNLTLAMKEQNIEEIEIRPYQRDNLSFIKEMLKKSNLPENGKITIFDGKTDEAYRQPVTVGYMYTMPMEHKVDNKFNARSIGSYSTITEQPLAGRSNRGGQKTGQMELWCLESFGAKSTILEKTSILSDDMLNKKRLLKNMIFGGHKFKFGRTSTFNLFSQLLRSLCFKSNLEIQKERGSENTINEETQNVSEDLYNKKTNSSQEETNIKNTTSNQELDEEEQKTKDGDK